MAQIINISNSVDPKVMHIPTTPNDDEEDGDEHRQLLASLPNTNEDPIVVTTITATDMVVPSPTVVGLVENRNEYNRNELSSCNNQAELILDIPTSDDSPSGTSNHLPVSIHENALNQLLLNDEHSSMPVYTTNIGTEDERISSSNSSTTSENPSVYKRRKSMVNYFYDMFISAFLITPLLNIHWRGAWDFLDIYLLPDYPYTSALVSLGVGLVLLYVIYVTQGCCQTFYENNRRKMSGIIMSRFHTIILSLAYIQQWRGVWNLIDLTSNEWYYLVGETVGCLIVLILVGDVPNVNCAPFLIGIDTESYFIVDAKYQVSANKFLQRSLDFLFYEVIEGPFLIIAWRALYNLSDLYISPDDKRWSTILSFSSGYGAYFVLAIIQIPILRCLIRLGYSWMYTFVSNVFHLIAFVSVVQIWRSLWLICEQYLNIPDYHDLTLSLCYGVSLVVLICGLAVRSLNGPTGSSDDTINENMPPFFQFDYLSIMLRKKTETRVQPREARQRSVSELDRPLTVDEALAVN